MITFFQTSDCPGCEAIQEVLDDLGVACKVVVVPQHRQASLTGGGIRKASLPEGTNPPVLVDDDKVLQGTRNIIAYLEELKGFKDLWYKYQSDVCYCD